MFLVILLLVLYIYFIWKVIKWAKGRNEQRIYSRFNGELAKKLRTHLPNNAIVYAVTSMAIDWTTESGEEKILWFSSLGFGNLPNGYEYVGCQWIRDFIVRDKQNYHFEPMTYERDHWEESTTGTLKREYRGTYTYTRDPGKFVTTETTIGHALVRNGYDFEGRRRVNPGSLKKW